MIKYIIGKMPLKYKRCKNEDLGDDCFKNPLTGRLVHKDGTIFKKLVRDGVLNPDGSPAGAIPVKKSKKEKKMKTEKGQYTPADLKNIKSSQLREMSIPNLMSLLTPKQQKEARRDDLHKDQDELFTFVDLMRDELFETEEKEEEPNLFNIAKQKHEELLKEQTKKTKKPKKSKKPKKPKKEKTIKIKIVNKVPETMEEKDAQRFENSHSSVVIQGAAPTMGFVKPVDADIQVAPVRPPLISSPADRFIADIEKGMPSSYLVQASLEMGTLKMEQDRVNKELQKYIEQKELDEFARQEINREWDQRERLMELRRQKLIVKPREKIREAIKGKLARGRQQVPTISYARVVRNADPISNAGKAVQFVDETQAEITRRTKQQERLARVRERMKERKVKKPAGQITNVIQGRLARGVIPAKKNTYSNVVQSKPSFGIV